MRSCREITELVSKGLDRKLGIGEKIAVNFHLMMCSRCRNFRSKTQFLRKAAKGYFDQLQQSNKKP